MRRFTLQADLPWVVLGLIALIEIVCIVSALFFQDTYNEDRGGRVSVSVPAPATAERHKPAAGP